MRNILKKIRKEVGASLSPQSLPDTLREIPRVRQIEGEPPRRWFSAVDLDLIVWIDPAKCFSGFQFCHRVRASEHALTWHSKKGFDYAQVDSGEPGYVGYKATPILRINGVPNLVMIRQLFEAAAAELPEDIRKFVLDAFSCGPIKSSKEKRRSAKSRPRKKRRK